MPTTTETQSVSDIRRPPPAGTLRDDEWSVALVQVADQRDRDAFGQLFRHFSPLLKAFALSNGGLSSDALAEELVQEVMIKVWNRAETFNPTKASATTWIYTLARNARIDLLRKRKRLSVEIETDELWELADEHLVEPADSAEQARLHGEIGDALSTLPEDQRQVVGKVYIEGKSHTEVAEELGLPLGTVKSRVRLALSKMKLILDR